MFNIFGAFHAVFNANSNDFFEMRVFQFGAYHPKAAIHLLFRILHYVYLVGVSRSTGI